MNIELRRVMTVKDYLAWGTSRPERVRAELINGQVVLMAEHFQAKHAPGLLIRGWVPVRR